MLLTSNVVDVEHAHAEETDGAAGQEGVEVGEVVGADIVGSAHGHKTEEDEDEEVAPAAIAVGAGAEGVAHGSGHGAGSEQEEQEGLQGQEGAEGGPDHARSAQGTADGDAADEALHLGDGHGAVLQGVVDALAVVVVGALEGVAQLVGEVGEDLQQDSGGDEQGHGEG